MYCSGHSRRICFRLQTDAQVVECSKLKILSNATIPDRSQTGILYVTHNIEEALALSDKLAILNKGRLEQLGRTDDVLSNPGNDFVKRFLKV
jgi:ABC-type proline/glycine betaine transport system ATPase subunit